MRVCVFVRVFVRVHVGALAHHSILINLNFLLYLLLVLPETQLINN